MKNYIVTGHKGLIGEQLKKRLDSKGYNCILSIDSREGFNVLNLELFCQTAGLELWFITFNKMGFPWKTL